MQDTNHFSGRSVSARLGVLGRADGSCQWSQGDTSVLVAVWGPNAPKRAAQALPDRAFVDIRVIEDINDNVNQNSNLEGRDNPTDLKTSLLSTLKAVILDSLHPRCQISIVVQVIADEGGLLSACINAITMALIDAGISVSGFISSSTVAIASNSSIQSGQIPADGELSSDGFFLDPTNEQIEISHGLLTAAWDHRGRQVFRSYKMNYDPSLTGNEGEQEDKFWQATDIAKKAAAKLLNFQRQTIKQKVLYEASAGLPAEGAATVKA